MKHLKTTILITILSMFALTTFAQKVEDGKKFLYYERYKSANEVLDQVIAKDDKDKEAAIYYKGQALLGLEKMKEAKKLYLDNMALMPNSPLILAGVGHIELMEGKKAEARQRFETAISLSKGKDLEVLNAIGLANGNYDSKNGDAAYAVDVLKQAMETRRFKDPETMINLGNAYRKLGNGGEALRAYEQALEYDNDNARALYRIGRMYQSQGRGQENLYLRYYNDATAKDATFAPVYATLFNYYFETDVPRSAGYLEKLLQNSDDDPQACNYRASIKYAQGLFQEAIAKADECITAGGNSALAGLYKVKAFSYKRLNDTAAAKRNFNEYFTRQNPEKIEGGDYAAYAGLLVNYPNNEATVMEYTNKAISLDTLPANKASYIATIGAAYEAQKNSKMAGIYYGKLLDVKRNVSNVDIFNAGYQFYNAALYDSSNKYFAKYVEKYPEDIMGYYMLANANSIIDSTQALGLAVPYYEKTIEIALKDTTAPQAINRAVTSYKYFVGYHANTTHDKAKAMAAVEGALALMPNDPTLLSYKQAISSMPENKPAANPPANNGGAAAGNK